MKKTYIILSILTILLAYDITEVTAMEGNTEDRRIEEMVEKIRRSSVALVVPTSGSQIMPIATGFLYTPDDTKEEIIEQTKVNELYVISCAHVLDSFTIDSIGIRANFHFPKETLAEGEVTKREFFNFTVDSIVEQDPVADLLIIDITEQIKKLSRLDCSFAITKKMLTKGPSLPTIFDQLIMIGYGKEYYDRTNNLPLLRWGRLASDPSKDFDGDPHYVVDWTALHGSSGAPVYSINKGEVNFMGVSCATETYKDNILDSTTLILTTLLSKHPLNFSHVVKKQKLIEWLKI